MVRTSPPAPVQNQRSFKTYFFPQGGGGESTSPPLQGWGGVGVKRPHLPGSRATLARRLYCCLTHTRGVPSALHPLATSPAPQHWGPRNSLLPFYVALPCVWGISRDSVSSLSMILDPRRENFHPEPGSSALLLGEVGY